jgi:hypothetical protein
MEQPSIHPSFALGEAWGYHIGHFLAQQRYATTASCQKEQVGGATYCGNNANINVLENFNPNLSSDLFKWIPKGLMEDLMDYTNEINPITDNVQGFSIQQIFAALQSDVTSVTAYRDRFIQQNPGNQSQQITDLFGQYHY